MARPHIAILGGGLTGLSSAFHLSRQHPEALISVFEKSSRLGGWVDSERIKVSHPEGGTAEILLEAGPRTLRPNSKAVLELINLLDLKDTLVTTTKSSPAAKNRYLQIPEVQAHGIIPLPNSILSLLSSPLRTLLLPNVLREPTMRGNRPPGLEDESLDSFMSRRFGSSFARNFGSALVHGIYAADSRKLSVRAAFPSLWDAEERGWGSVVRGMLLPSGSSSSPQDYDLGDIPDGMKDVSVFSFKDGMSTIIDALLRHLGKCPNVQMLTETGVERLEVDEERIEMKTTIGTTVHPTYIASALQLPALHSILSPPSSLPHLTANPYSSVTVMNIIFPQSNFHPRGFGYLIPRPLADYSETDAGILGTVFDSCALSAQDYPEELRSQFTKLTVMLGGPYPIGSKHISEDHVLQKLEAHLSDEERTVKLPKPLLVRTRRHKSCIPTPTPGHLQRMEELRRTLSGGPWKGRLEVIGAGVGGVSVGDCVEAGKRVGGEWNL